MSIERLGWCIVYQEGSHRCIWLLFGTFELLGSHFNWTTSSTAWPQTKPDAWLQNRLGNYWLWRQVLCFPAGLAAVCIADLERNNILRFNTCALVLCGQGDIKFPLKGTQSLCTCVSDNKLIISAEGNENKIIQVVCKFAFLAIPVCLSSSFDSCPGKFVETYAFAFLFVCFGFYCPFCIDTKVGKLSSFNEHYSGCKFTHPFWVYIQ